MKSRLATSSLLLLIGGILALFIIGGSAYYMKSHKEEPVPAKEQVVSKSTKKAVPEKAEQDLKEGSDAQPSFGYATPSVTLILSILLLISSLTSIYLFRWRRKVSDQQVSIVPSQLLSVLEQQLSYLNSYTGAVDGHVKQAQLQRHESEQKLNQILDSFRLFQDSLGKKDEEIERLKRGYDQSIYQGFLSRFIKVYVHILGEMDASKSEPKINQILEDFRAVFEDALRECGVETISPALGSAVSAHDYVGAHYKRIPTNDNSQHLKIAEIYEPAFALRTSVGKEILRPAKVAVYIMEEASNG